MADEVIENSAVINGKELLDATQNAVINAVENVSEIIEKKEEKQSLEELIEEIIEPSEPIYLETEFWVAMAFCLLVIALIFPAFRVIKSLLGKKIEGIIKSINDAVELRDNAQKLLADYERKFISSKAEGDDIVQKAKNRVDLMKKEKISQLEYDMFLKTKNVKLKIDTQINDTRREIRDMICGISINTVKNLCKEKISSEEQNRLIDDSIALVRKLK